jgi:hypothetical protein
MTPGIANHFARAKEGSGRRACSPPRNQSLRSLSTSSSEIVSFHEPMEQSRYISAPLLSKNWFTCWLFVGSISMSSAQPNRSSTRRISITISGVRSLESGGMVKTILRSRLCVFPARIVSVGCQLDRSPAPRLSVGAQPHGLRLSAPVLRLKLPLSAGRRLSAHPATYYQTLAPCATAAPRVAHSSHPRLTLARIRV